MAQVSTQTSGFVSQCDMQKFTHPLNEHGLEMQSDQLSLGEMNHIALVKAIVPSQCHYIVAGLHPDLLVYIICFLKQTMSGVTIILSRVMYGIGTILTIQIEHTRVYLFLFKNELIYLRCSGILTIKHQFLEKHQKMHQMYNYISMSLTGIIFTLVLNHNII